MFDQIDGVAMSSPLAPVFVNQFLGHYEYILLKEYIGPPVHSYWYYVDDTFCAFNTENEYPAVVISYAQYSRLCLCLYS